jgi:SPP1 gp7 family putative phage head morphogenesis protein
VNHADRSFSGRARRRILAHGISHPRLAEELYARALRTIIGHVHAQVATELGFHLDSYNRRTGSLDEMGIRVVAAVRKPVEKAFDKMAGSVSKKNKLGLAGIKPSDLRIGGAMDTIREKNVHLMQKASEAFISDVSDVLQENYGESVKTLASKLQERVDVSKSKAEFIARDQTLKLNGEINKIRQTNAGVTDYVWSTSKDERVRPEHAELEGQTFSWNDPPEPGHPGEDFQCRCVAIPVIEP